MQCLPSLCPDTKAPASQEAATPLHGSGRDPLLLQRSGSPPPQGPLPHGAGGCAEPGLLRPIYLGHLGKLPKAGVPDAGDIQKLHLLVAAKTGCGLRHQIEDEEQEALHPFTSWPTAFSRCQDYGVSQTATFPSQQVGSPSSCDPPPFLYSHASPGHSNYWGAVTSSPHLHPRCTLPRVPPPSFCPGAETSLVSLDPQGYPEPDRESAFGSNSNSILSLQGMLRVEHRGRGSHGPPWGHPPQNSQTLPTGGRVEPPFHVTVYCWHPHLHPCVIKKLLGSDGLAVVQGHGRQGLPHLTLIGPVQVVALGIHSEDNWRGYCRFLQRERVSPLL